METKQCPYCGEEILAVAKKCKHCGEWLEKNESEKEKKICPVCGEMIDMDTEICPYCDEPTHYASNKTDTSFTPQKITNKEKMSDSIPQKTQRFFANNAGTFFTIFLVLIYLGVKFGKNIYKQMRYSENVKESVFKAPVSTDDNFKIIPTSKSEFDILIESPWFGRNSFTLHEIDNGVNLDATIVIDSKKTYSKNNEYVEDGTLIFKIEITANDAYAEIEAKMPIKLKGVFTYQENQKRLVETSKSVSCGEADIKVIKNNTNIGDEYLIAQMDDNVNSMRGELFKTNNKNYVDVKELTNTSLVLVEKEGQDLVEYRYSRK